MKMVYSPIFYENKLFNIIIFGFNENRNTVNELIKELKNEKQSGSSKYVLLMKLKLKRYKKKNREYQNKKYKNSS